MNTLKHHKVLSRGSEFTSLLGLRLKQNILLQLWWINETQKLPGSSVGNTLHDMLSQATLAQEKYPAVTDELIVQSSGLSREQLHTAILRMREEVSSVGRSLAGLLGFRYPSELEDAVKDDWDRYMGRIWGLQTKCEMPHNIECT